VRRSLVWTLLIFIGVAFGSLAATIAVGHSPLLGLDLRGGVSVVLQPQGTTDASTLQEAVTIIDRRVNGLGVANSQIARQGNDVVINLPNVKDPQKALNILGETATLYFRSVICEVPAYAAPAKSTTTTTKPPTTPTTRAGAKTTPTTAKAFGPAPAYRLTSAVFPAAGPTTTTKTTTTPTTAPTSATTIVPSQSSGSSVPLTSPTNATQANADCAASNAAQLPTTPVQADTQGSYVILPYYDNTIRYVLGPADMTGSGVSTASLIVDPNTSQYEVQVSFTGSGSKQFDAIAAKRYPYYQQNTTNPPYTSLEAFELDGVVESAPTIQAASFSGSAVISGSTSSPFTQSQASQLALELKYGSLPVRFTPQSVQTVSATIGNDSLKAGLFAGLGGILVVLLYMIAYYRALGLVVVLGLAVGGSLLYSIITLLGVTENLALTLAGVTGIIVSVGITVDSYVVYFERLKDEIRAGRSIRQSVERSFSRAFRTVLTADFVAFLAAAILYLFTVGDVRGFAYMLGLSTVLDVVTAFMFIRPMVILVGRRRTFTEARILGVARGLGAGTAPGTTP
jgi:preprotein translocase subunit SecD